MVLHTLRIAAVMQLLCLHPHPVVAGADVEEALSMFLPMWYMFCTWSSCSNHHL